MSTAAVPTNHLALVEIPHEPTVCGLEVDGVYLCPACRESYRREQLARVEQDVRRAFLKRSNPIAKEFVDHFLLAAECYPSSLVNVLMGLLCDHIIDVVQVYMEGKQDAGPTPVVETRTRTKRPAKRTRKKKITHSTVKKGPAKG
jgi:hypothetical protein